MDCLSLMLSQSRTHKLYTHTDAHAHTDDKGRQNATCSHEDTRTFKAAIPDSVGYLGSQPREIIICISKNWVWLKPKYCNAWSQNSNMAILIDLIKKYACNMLPFGIFMQQKGQVCLTLSSKNVLFSYQHNNAAHCQHQIFILNTPAIWITSWPFISPPLVHNILIT